MARKITGHVTNTMYKRYRIVDDSDMKGALAQRAIYEATQLEAARAKAEEAARVKAKKPLRRPLRSKRN